jgi:hypothetical protein
MRPGRLVPPVELEIPTQPHSTGCPPSTTATNKTARPKFKLFVRETGTSHTAVISLAREKRCHKCAECRLSLHGRRVGQEIFLFTGNRRLELAAAVFHAPLVTNYLVVRTVLRYCNLARHSPDSRQRSRGPCCKSPDEHGRRDDAWSRPMPGRTAAGRAALDALITEQAQIIAYIDDYKLLMIATLAVIPLLLVFRKASAGAVRIIRSRNGMKIFPSRDALCVNNSEYRS